MNRNFIDASFWRGRRVWLTGHTGFKGSWLALWLSEMGAEVTAVGLEPEGEPHLFHQLRLKERPPLPGKMTPLHPDHFHHQGA